MTEQVRYPAVKLMRVALHGGQIALPLQRKENDSVTRKSWP